MCKDADTIIFIYKSSICGGKKGRGGGCKILIFTFEMSKQKSVPSLFEQKEIWAIHQWDRNLPIDDVLNLQ